MNKGQECSAWHVLAGNAQRKCKGLESHLKWLEKGIKKFSKEIDEGDTCKECNERMKTVKFIEGFAFKCTNENCREGLAWIERERIFNKRNNL